MTVSVTAVPNFNTLTVADATVVLYEQVVPACEDKDIRLSYYGNHSGQGSLETVVEYNVRKVAQTLFRVPDVQRAFAALAGLVGPASTYKIGSYGLKHAVEELPGQTYLTNGDVIAAMLMRGHAARFGKRGELPQVNCEFKVKYM